MRVPRRSSDDATTIEGGPDAAMTPAQRRASLAAVLALAVVGILTLRGLLPALLWALVFAIALWPLRQRLRARWPRHRRVLVPAVLVLAVVLLFVIPVSLVAVPLIVDAHAAAAWFAQARQSGIPAPPTLGRLPMGETLTGLWQNELGRPGSLSELATRAAHGSLVNIGRTVAAQAARRLVLLSFMLLTLFFLLRDGDAFAGELRVASRRAFGPAGERVGEQIIRSVRGTVDGLVLVGFGQGIILGIAYAIAGVPRPALFGLLTGLLAMVPFGAEAAILVSGGVLFLSGASVAAAAIVAFGLGIKFVADHFVRPVLIGGATRLPFLWVLLGILGGLEAWGLVGLFIGPAIMAALVLLWDEWVGKREGPLNPTTGVGDAGVQPAAASPVEAPCRRSTPAPPP